MLIVAYARLYGRLSTDKNAVESQPADMKDGPGLKKMGNRERSDKEIDKVLVKRIAAGDVAAFSLLSERYLVKVVSLSRRMLGDEAEAEDIAQECFLRVWKRADSFDPDKASFSTWLYRVAGNLCIDRIRKRKSQGVVEPLEYAENVGVPADQEREMAKKQLEERVDQALQILPDRQRQALVLCHFQGLRMKEASSIMEVSVEALESLLARGRRSLKKELEAEWMQFMPERAELQ